MSNVYEVIDAIRLYKGYSMRVLAKRADIPYTSLASLMQRRSNRISKDMLGKLIGALGVEWIELQAFQPVDGEDGDEGKWFGAICSMKDAYQILENVIGSGFERFLSEARQKEKKPSAQKKHEQQTASVDHREPFKQSMNLMFDRLNDNGLLEAMRRIVEIAQDPRYSIDTDPNIPKDD